MELELLTTDFMRNDLSDSVASEDRRNGATASTLLISSSPSRGTDLSHCCALPLPPGLDIFIVSYFSQPAPERRDFRPPSNPPLPPISPGSHGPSLGHVWRETEEVQGAGVGS